MFNVTASKSQDFNRGWMWFSAVPLAEINIVMWPKQTERVRDIKKE